MSLESPADTRIVVKNPVVEVRTLCRVLLRHVMTVNATVLSIARWRLDDTYHLEEDPRGGTRSGALVDQFTHLIVDRRLIAHSAISQNRPHVLRSWNRVP